MHAMDAQIQKIEPDPKKSKKSNQVKFSEFLHR